MMSALKNRFRTDTQGEVCFFILRAADTERNEIYIKKYYERKYGGAF